PEALRRFDLAGRVAVVTGASAGLGEGLARALASVGARVAVVARRHDRLVKLAEEIGGVAGRRRRVGPGGPRKGAPRGSREVSAAGNIFPQEPAEREPLEVINQTLGLNLVAPFRLSQDVFPHMVAAGRGAIVYVSSISGRVGVPGIPQASYAASKLGLSGLTAELAVQWARHAIRVNTVAPGFFRSEITEGMYDDERTLAWLR